MLIAKLTISYDRGLSRNHESDLETSADGFKGKLAVGKGQKTPDGKVIRGLGTHYRSEEDARLVGERDEEARRVMRSFSSALLRTPIEGTYYLPVSGYADRILRDLNVRPDVKVYVSEYNLESQQGLDEAELSQWALRVKNQLAGVTLGRKKEADEEGLAALVTLSRCPILAKKTGTAIREMVELVRANKLQKVELKRNLDKMVVELDESVIVAPRRAPVEV